MIPEVSIICSAYNAEKTIRSTIESVLSQTYKKFEFIVVDDGSFDSTASIINEYAKADSRLVFLKRNNHGLTKSLNYAANMASKDSNLLARIDADDIWHPEKLQKQIYEMTSKGLHLLGTFYNEISAAGDVINSECSLPTSHAEICEALPFFNPFIHSSILINKSIFFEFHGYDERFKFAQDYELWSRVLRKYTGGNLNEVLVSRFYSPSMISIAKERQQRFSALRVKFMNAKFISSYKRFILQVVRDLSVCFLPKLILRLLR